MTTTATTVTISWAQLGITSSAAVTGIAGNFINAAVCADIPHFDVRKSGMPNIIEVFVGQVSHEG